MKERIYVCHTFYHVYITILKELALEKNKQGEATIVLSRLSNDFGDIDERLRASGLFEDVIWFDEKRDDFFPELAKYRKDKGNIVFNMISRIIFTRKYAKLEEAYVPVNFRDYKNIYVFCDTDPIGYYLNQKKIRYHAVEDGYNCLEKLDAARYDNRGAFKLKAFMSKKLNLIFVQNGYGKYCMDMEVNDISVITHPCPYYIEKPRKELIDRLTARDKEIILSVFMKNKAEVLEALEKDKDRDRVLILTEPLCDLKTRKKIFKDLADEYGKYGMVVFKPHPRDVLDYKPIFPDNQIIDKTVPMEMLNYLPVRFSKIVSVFTRLGSIEFADEKIELGADFMDKYEAPELHRFEV